MNRGSHRRRQASDGRRDKHHRRGSFNRRGQLTKNTNTALPSPPFPCELTRSLDKQQKIPQQATGESGEEKTNTANRKTKKNKKALTAEVK